MMHIFRSMSIENVMSPRPALPRRRGGHGAAVFAQGPAWGQLGCPPRTALPRCRGEHGAAVRRASPAWGADVISSNVVGYNKVDLNRGYNMLAVQFNEVGGGAQNIQDIFTGNLPDMSVDEEGYPVWNAKLQTWNGVGYDNFYWTGSVGGELFEDSSYNNVWVVGQYGDSVANVNIGVGEPFFIWLRSGSNVTATFTK